MRKIKCEDYEVTYEETDMIKQAVFDRVMKYFTEHEAFNGESIMQCDSPQIDAPSVLADIADNIIKFKYI
jgi:hypothetical protein